jgi:hypothetical protein
MLLDLSSYPRNSANTSSRKLGNFKTRRKHILDKRSILVDFEWMTNELQFFDDLNTLVDIKHDSSSTNSERSLK